jgi:SAM-dependent methyltransferase
MGDRAYDELAAVYEFLVPDTLLEPEGAAAAFADVPAELDAGARVLDCAAGTGQLAVGLALRGFGVTATDASAAMVERTRALAAHHGVELIAATCTWAALGRQGWDERFDAVLCVGNSLTHAPGRDGRRVALAAMAGVLRPGGLLALTSRNWERLLAERPGLEIDGRLVERGGRRGLVARSWTIPDDWEQPHFLEVAVALLGADGGVETHGERLPFWPFTKGDLNEDLRAVGLAPASSTYAADSERYLVTARRAGG